MKGKEDEIELDEQEYKQFEQLCPTKFGTFTLHSNCCAPRHGSNQYRSINQIHSYLQLQLDRHVACQKEAIDVDFRR